MMKGYEYSLFGSVPRALACIESHTRLGDTFQFWIDEMTHLCLGP